MLTQDKGSGGCKSSSNSASTPAPSASSAATPTPVPATSAQSPPLTPASTAPAAPTASAPTASSFPPSPNCRIREVHCGSQVRLVVIAIRDITKGEEITVDYSLTEWGENLVSWCLHVSFSLVSGWVHHLFSFFSVVTEASVVLPLAPCWVLVDVPKLPRADPVSCH